MSGARRSRRASKAPSPFVALPSERAFHKELAMAIELSLGQEVEALPATKKRGRVVQKGRGPARQSPLSSVSLTTDDSPSGERTLTPSGRKGRLTHKPKKAPIGAVKPWEFMDASDGEDVDDADDVGEADEAGEAEATTVTEVEAQAEAFEAGALVSVLSPPDLPRSPASSGQKRRRPVRPRPASLPESPAGRVPPAATGPVARSESRPKARPTTSSALPSSCPSSRPTSRPPSRPSSRSSSRSSSRPDSRPSSPPGAARRPPSQAATAKGRRFRAPERFMDEVDEAAFQRNLRKAMSLSTAPSPPPFGGKSEESPVDAAPGNGRVKPPSPSHAPKPKPRRRPPKPKAAPQLKAEAALPPVTGPMGAAAATSAQKKRKRSSVVFDNYKFDWTQAVAHRQYVGVASLYERFVAFAWVRGRREVLGWFDSSVEAALAYDEAMTARYGDKAEKNFTSFLDDKGERLPEFARGVHR